MTDAIVASLNVGSAQANPKGKGPDTGIGKHPIAEAHLRDPGPKTGGLGSGVVGDFVGDARHHGGSGQAVYAFASAELQWWGNELGRQLPPGAFGENLTTAGIDVDAAVVGQLWQVGEAVLRVTGPRLPCATFAATMGVRGWVKTFSERGRTGVYLAVVEPGLVRTGDAIAPMAPPAHGVTVPELFWAITIKPELAARVLDARDDLADELVGRLEARQPYDLDPDPLAGA